jgi:long-chain acyl-CoA synthetase
LPPATSAKSTRRAICISSGRRKNLLITSYGRNIAPEWVESVLLAEPAYRAGAGRRRRQPWLSAILVPSPGADHGAIAAAVRRANQTLPDYARIGRWHAAAPFTAGNGLATGNGRPIRAAIFNVTMPPNWLHFIRMRKPAMSFYEQLIAATAADRAQLLAAPVIADCLQGRVTWRAISPFSARPITTCVTPRRC